LIELAYADERQIEQLLGAEGAEAKAARNEYLPALRELQRHNIVRSERLEKKLEAAASAPPPPSPDGAAPDEKAAEIQQQRFELAQQLLTLALARMDDVERTLAADTAVEWSAGHAASRKAVEHLAALRRLFFSIVEELRDVAQQQVELADETRDAAALAAAGSEDAAARTGPLAPRQQALAARSGDLADALAEQSNQTGGVVDEEADSAETSRRLREAGEHVLLAQEEMEGALGPLGEQPPNLASTQERQAAAIVELERALALLVPPEDRQNQDDSGSSGKQDSAPEPKRGEKPKRGEQTQGGEQQQQKEAQPQAPPADPAQLLQAVRDREAQRRRDREQRGSEGYDTVEKDW